MAKKNLALADDDDQAVQEQSEQVPSAVEEAEPDEKGPGLLAVLRKKSVWIPLISVLVLAIAGGTGSYLYRMDQQKRAQAEAARAAAAKKAAAEEKKLVAEFDQLMEIRAEILAAEAASGEAVVVAKTRVADFDKRTAAREKKVEKLDDAYEEEYQEAVDWNNDLSKIGYKQLPDYPDMPDQIPTPTFDAQVKALKQADADLREATAKLTDMDLNPKFQKLVAQMKEASQAISEEALHNADVLTTSVEPPAKGEMSEDSPGYIDKKLFATLRGGAAKAVFTFINDDCLKFVKDHDLDIRLYDLKGGRDVNGKDSSLLASEETSSS